ncbi:TPA: hypothetical protein ACP32N_003157 [Pseudomonas aeruginosa]
MKPVTVAIVLLALGGCAVEQPAWITDRPHAYCYKSADDKCLADLISAHLTKTPEGPTRDEAVWKALAAIRIAGTDEPEALKTLQIDAERFSCTIQGLYWELAAEAVQEAKAGRYNHALTMISQIQGKDPRTFSLTQLVEVSSDAKDDQALAQVLDILSKDDERAYMDALLLRLQVLLNQGDFERSTALQNHLLEYFAKDPATGTEPTTEMVLSYLSNGMKLDAKDFLAKAGDQIPGLQSADNLKLFGLVSQVIEGYYPTPDDFYQFSTDKARLKAYLVLARYYRSLGNKSMVTSMLVDASRFTQKASFKGNRTDVASSFAAFLRYAR